MNSIAAFGRILFATAMVGFGIQYFLARFLVVGVELIPPYPPSHLIWGFIVASLLILCGLCLAFRWIPLVASFALVALFLNTVVVIDLPRIMPNLLDLQARTRFLETLCLAAGAMIVAGITAKGTRSSGVWRAIQIFALIGAWLFALSMIIFGIDHFLIPAFIASLVPAWIPSPLFWAYFTATAFVLAGIAIVVRIFARTAMFLLGLMFLAWVVVLHGPRIAAALSNIAEWNSGLVALAMAGCAFALCGSTAVRRGV